VAREIYAIVNPVSGGGKGQTILREIDKMEKGRDNDKRMYTVCTEKKGHRNAGSLTKEAIREGYDLIIGVGGNGTLNEIANELTKSNRKIPLAIIPAGKGNDFAKALNIPLSPKQALDLAIHGRPMPIDVGKVNGRTL